MNQNILAGIVTYNPCIDRLKKNIDSISHQVSDVVIIDNGSSNIEEIQSMLISCSNAKIVCNEFNRGIAAALNQIGDVAYEKNKEFFITLDQDSISDEKLVEKLYSVLENNSIGIACPYINRHGDFSSADVKREVKTAITSGSMVRTKAWTEVGGFWEYLFIDEVDHEFCYQLRRKGYGIVQTNAVAIDHIIGTPFSKKIMGHTFHPTNHSAFRRYFISRNNLIMAHLFPDEKEPFGNRYMMLIRMTISIILCEDRKLEKTASICKGVKDGIIWNVRNKECGKRRL